MKMIWLLIDRVDKADDNAEFFYRWLKKNKPEVKLYFGLSSKSPDWQRLSNEGFNLIDFEIKALTKRADVLRTITHILVSNPIKLLMVIAPQAAKIFLQHGITNRRAYASVKYIKQIMSWADCILATSEKEKELLNTEPYSIPTRKICVTGFPRHDSLIQKSLSTSKKYICIQPHWAMYLKDPDNELLNSQYFQGWKALLQSKELKQYITETGNEVVLRLHPCSYKYEQEWLNILPDYIHYIDKNVPFQTTFAESKLYVSDYSSNMFEVGIIDTPCIYYRPDAEYVRTTKAGDFEKNILGVIGPSTYTVQEFINTLRFYTQNNFQLEEQYEKVRNDIFPYKLDEHNCERCFEAIIQFYPHFTWR